MTGEAAKAKFPIAFKLELRLPVSWPVADTGTETAPFIAPVPKFAAAPTAPKAKLGAVAAMFAIPLNCLNLVEEAKVTKKNEATTDLINVFIVLFKNYFKGFYTKKLEMKTVKSLRLLC